MTAKAPTTKSGLSSPHGFSPGVERSAFKRAWTTTKQCHSKCSGTLKDVKHTGMCRSFCMDNPRSMEIAMLEVVKQGLRWLKDTFLRNSLPAFSFSPFLLSYQQYFIISIWRSLREQQQEPTDKGPLVTSHSSYNKIQIPYHGPPSFNYF